MSNGVIIRPLVSSLPGKVLMYAKRVGAVLSRSEKGSVSRVFEGHLIHATKRQDKSVIVTIMYPEGSMFFGAEVAASYLNSPPQDFAPYPVSPIAYTMPMVRMTKSENVNEPEEADPDKIKGYDFSASFASGTPRDDATDSLSISPFTPHGQHAVIVAEYQQDDAGGLFGAQKYLAIAAYSGRTRRIPAGGEIPAFTGSKLQDRRFVTLVDGLFDGVTFNVGEQRLHEYPDSDPVWYPAMSGNSNVPAQAFVIKHPVTGVRNCLLLVKNIDEASVPGANWAYAIANPPPGDGSTLAHGAYRVDHLCGHGISLIDIGITEEESENPDDALDVTPLADRIMVATSWLLTDYEGLTGTGQTFPAYTLAFDEELEAEEHPYPYSPIEIIPSCHTQNNILQMSSAVIERVGDTEPETPRELAYGELPDYYGNTKAIVAITVQYQYGDAWMLDETPIDPPPDPPLTGDVFTVTSTLLFVHEISPEGDSIGMDSMVVSTCEQLEGSPAIFDMHYLYCSSGWAVPMVSITLDESIEPPEDPLTATIGAQVAGTAAFKLAYSDLSITTFNLGGYEPPRPIMRGGNFDSYFSQFPWFQYDESGVDAETKTIWALGEAPTTELVTSSNLENARIADLNRGTINQKIHAHIGNGKIVILATDGTDADVRINWSVVTCYESTGERTDDPAAVVFESLPLESSNWISITCLEEEDGGKKAVLLCSLQRPTSRFYNDHPIHARLTPYMFDAGKMSSFDAFEYRHPDIRHKQVISKDGGTTWEPFLDGMPGDGYYLGNALQSKNLTR